MDRLAMLAFGGLFLACTVAVGSFILVAWFGTLAGLLWLAVSGPIGVFVVYQLLQSINRFR